MKLHAPFKISARLLPAVQVGNAWISIKAVGVTGEGRTRFEYFIDTPDFEHSARDLKSGVGGSSVQQAMETLLSFLGAAAESYRYRGSYTGDPDDNSSLFPQQVTEWAYQNSDELSLLECELSESVDLITD